MRLVTVDRLQLFVVGFGRPDLLREQVRLLRKHLRDPFDLLVLDNTKEPDDQKRMEDTAADLAVGYFRVISKRNEHDEALRIAGALSRDLNCRFWGCLDHDVMPYRPTTIIDRLERHGFFGLGQTYTPRVGRSLRYLWPGWVFFDSAWLGKRHPNFSGIRGAFRFDDGDTGSMLHSLFTEADLEGMEHVVHGYETIREDDGHGLQSFGFERMGDWVHLTNASRWKDVPDPDQRDALLREMLEAL